VPEMSTCLCGCLAEVSPGSKFLKGHYRRGKKFPSKPRPAVDPSYCKCGCGELTTIYRGKPRKFVKGHQARGDCNSRFGQKLGPETRQKISRANKLAAAEGRHPHLVAGWVHTEEAKNKMYEAHSKLGFAPRTPRRGITRACKHCGKPYYRPQSVTQTGYCSLSCAAKENCKGCRNPFYGKTHTEEARKRLSEASIAQRARSVVLPTKPEKKVHESLRAHGVEFLTEHPLGKFCVDVYIPALKVALFVDGCYWHACPDHFPKGRRPKWDAARVPHLTKLGYRVVLVWEHELKEDPWKALQGKLTGTLSGSK
jgi:DNA mismatch endonuclease (patch repair protein)